MEIPKHIRKLYRYSKVLSPDTLEYQLADALRDITAKWMEAEHYRSCTNDCKLDHGDLAWQAAAHAALMQKEESDG